MTTEQLIGRKFRRNKYGISIWDDEITAITIRLQLVKQPSFLGSIGDQLKKRTESGKKYGFKPMIQVKGNGCWYDINEIIIF